MSRIEFELDIPGTGGQSCSSKRYFVRDDLKLLRLDLHLIALGMMFQSFAPIILNDVSNSLWILALQVLDMGGILHSGPRRFD